MQLPDPSSCLPLLLHLDLWDAGADALSKYDYIKPAMLKDAVVALFCFSVTDRSSWEGLGDLVGGAGRGWVTWWVGLGDINGPGGYTWERYGNLMWESR